MRYKSENEYYVFSFYDVHNPPQASAIGWHFLSASRQMTLNLRSVVLMLQKQI